MTPFSPLWVFLDDRDDIVALACACGGQEWVVAASAVEETVVRHALPGTDRRPAAVPWSRPAGVPEAYEALSAEIADKGSHRSFVVLAQSYIDAHFGEPTSPWRKWPPPRRSAPGISAGS